ncbi:MAG TPA: GHKL domain-containing protein [Candidatus Coprenecus pullistercoris]|nr:GHKL domain-containing protein [Candidatus Coprenecus pullistercoris]
MKAAPRNIIRYISTHLISVLWVLALCCFFLSFFQFTPTSSERRAERAERLLHKRESILQVFVDKALETPADEWLRFNGFPEDMVLYRYVDDTLQSWINTFPIINDGIGIPSSWYRIHDMRNRNIFNTPLAFLKDSVQYVNLGSKWYVVKVYDRDGMHVIAGIEIMETYASASPVLKNTCNSQIGLNDRYAALPPFIDDASVVRTSDGTPVFSVVKLDTTSGDNRSSSMRWASALFAIMAILLYQHRRKGLWIMFFGLGGIFLLQMCTFLMIDDMPVDIKLFSPMLYADGFFNSFGSLMLTHIFVFLYCSVVFMSRKAVIKNIRTSSPAARRVKAAALGLSIVLLAAYIHYTFRSLIFNSGINFDLYRINDISIYTICTYIIYCLLTLSVLFMLDIFISVAVKHYIRKRKRHSKRLVILYTLTAAIYMSGAVGIYGFQKECENLRVTTGRLAIERDLNLEMRLQAIEKDIISDPFIRRLSGNPEYESIVLNRLLERYFFNIRQKYDIRMTVCNMYQRIVQDEYTKPANCFGYFKNIIDNYGVQLSDMSAFYFLDYFHNNISYLGAFSIIRNGQRYDIYIELDSKESSDNIGYPSILLDNPTPSASALSYPYSLARYHQGRLTGHQGRYNFPVTVNQSKYKDGFSHYFYNDNVVFINKLPGTKMIAVSRPTRGILPSIISFSYLFLLLALIDIAIPRLFRKRHRESTLRPKRSFRMKMTLFITASTVIALIFMAIGSVLIILGYMRNNNTAIMEEMLLSVQGNLSKISRTANTLSDYRSEDIFHTLDGISRSAQVDINLYSPSGRLLHTTKPDIYNEYLTGTRMNPDAYYELVINRRMQLVQEESIASLDYYSLYTPIYNDEGRLLAIANIPYFISDTNFEYDASPIVAAIINLYLIFIIVALLTGIAMSNSITRPLKEISKNMLEMDISHKAEHINYKADDELGLLVRTYNNMIDDLDRSTRELAQREREQAWSEMARQIAHEIKNPLTPMKLSIQHLVRMKKQNRPDWQEKFEPLAASLIEQIDILSNTASEFSSFAKLYNEEETEVDLVEVLTEQKILFDNRDNIGMNFRRHVDKAVVLARKEQITRTFVNLITNAIQAVEGQEKGIINITLSMFPGRYQVDIEDNGSGVSEENLNKLFSPNFTTKTKGSGLGLAICKSIVTQSHGDIYYSQSKELGGADFTVVLPAYTRITEDYT